MAKIVSTLREVVSNSEMVVAPGVEKKSSPLIIILGVLLIAALIVGSIALVFAAFSL